MPAAVPSAGNAAACPGPGEAEEAARWETFTQVLASPDTVRRLFDRLSAQDLADAIGVWLLSRIELAPVCFPVAGPVLLPAIAIDGKAVRGAIPAGGQIPFLLAAATHASAATRQAATVVAERLIGAKTSEIPEVVPLLERLAGLASITGYVLTLDALHTVKKTAQFITGMGCHYVMTVKTNREHLYAMQSREVKGRAGLS